MYPDLTTSLLTFYLITFTVCLVIGLIIDKMVAFSFIAIPEFKYNKTVLICLFIYYVADIAYSGFIPLFAYSSGDIEYGPTFNFGIPTLHVIAVTFNVFFALYLFHQYVSNKKIRIFLLYLLTIIPFVILLSRSSIMYIIIGSFYIFVISRRKLPVTRVLRLVIIGLAALYLFGYLGNIRSANGDSTVVPRNSGVTDEFLDGWVPNEFYWSYLYIGSPVAGLQNNINTSTKVDPDVKSFFVYECLPDFISKKIAGVTGARSRSFNQLNDWLNVGTIYANSFSYLSWAGMALMFVYLMGLMNLYYLLISKSSLFKITGYAMMFNVIALGNFSNSIQFSAFSFQLVYPVLFSVILYQLNRWSVLKKMSVNAG